MNSAKKTAASCIVLVMASLCVGDSATAEEWRFPIGYSYISGLTNVRDDYRQNLETQGYTVSTDTAEPLGISFQPYVLFQNGFGIGGGIGPYLSSQSSAASFYALPVGLDVRYMFSPGTNTSSYVRIGGRYNIAIGSFVEHSTPGLFGGVGVEFFRKKTVGFSLELSYDASTVTLKDYQNSTNYGSEAVQPSGFMAGIFVVFSFDHKGAIAAREIKAVEQPSSASAPEPKQIEQTVSNVTATAAHDQPVTAQEIVHEQILSHLKQIPGIIHFAVNSTKISPKSAAVLSVIASVMRDDKAITLELRCYSDARGRKKYNEKLSKRRGDAVQASLVAAGVEPERISVKAFGSSNPVALSNSAVDNAHNRRVELVLSGISGVEFRHHYNDLQLEDDRGAE
jgi:outer membrane protein OmpA-like peptidoglycan-associated protein